MKSLKMIQLMHSQIMMIFQGNSLQHLGSLLEGWSKSDHTQHTIDVLEVRISSLNRQIENIDLTTEELDQVDSFRKMLKKDLKIMIFNIQNDQLPLEMIQSAKNYLNVMKNMIVILENF